jgi:ABC-type nitrate/sulfonate/bicarbonate transport system permease component
VSSIRLASSRIFSVTTQVVVLAAAIGVWQLCSATGLLAKNSFPSVPDVATELGRQLQTTELWESVWQTIQGWGIGLLIASALAIAVGTILGRIRFAYLSVIPVVEFLKVVPTIAILPLVIVVYGPTLEMKIFLVAWGIFWAMTIQVIYGVRAVDPVVRDNARVLRLRGLRLFRVVTLPSAAPYLATGLRIASAVGLILAVIAELIGGSPGLGLQILTAENAGPDALPTMYAYIFMTGVLGIAVTGIFTLLERRILHWHESQRNLRGAT